MAIRKSVLFSRLWQLPQFALGLLIRSLLAKGIKSMLQVEDAGPIVYRIEKFGAGVSFGPIILLDERCGAEAIAHEVGHSVQSSYLGPLYLIVVGLPSIGMNLLSRLSRRYGTGAFAARYYQRWPENWADELGRRGRR